KKERCVSDNLGSLEGDIARLAGDCSLRAQSAGAGDASAQASMTSDKNKLDAKLKDVDALCKISNVPECSALRTAIQVAKQKCDQDKATIAKAADAKKDAQGKVEKQIA